MSQHLPQLSQNATLGERMPGFTAIDGKSGNPNSSLLDRIAQKIRLNRCDKCGCRRLRHDLQTGRCNDCGCVNRRNPPKPKGKDLRSLFDLEGSEQ